MKRIILLIILFMLVVGAGYMVFIDKGKGRMPSSLSSLIFAPTPTPTYTPEQIQKGYEQTQARVDAENKDQADRDEKVAGLLDKVPYKGTYFSFTFDYTKGKFILTLDKNHKEQGEKNFITFLSKNEVEDRSWIQDLEIVIK